MHEQSNAVDRFWARVHKTNTCWLWLGPVNAGGYGMTSFKNGRADSKRGSFLAHRIAYELANGPIPAGMFVCHTCDVRNCIRPDHLWLGTNQDNMDDCKSKGRRPAGDTHVYHLHPEKHARGERSHTAKLTEDDVREIRRIYAAGGVRKCDLALRYGVTGMNILSIIRRETWKHVE